MSKKILIISAIILLLTVVLTACKGKEDSKPSDTTTKNVDEVVATVPVTNEEGTTINVPIYENESGDRYVTNYQGDKIPVTMDADGFNDDIGYLITQTTAPSTTKKDSSQKDDKTTAPSGNNGTTAPNGSTTTTAPAGDNASTTTSTTAPANDNTTTTTTTNQPSTSIVIGTGSGPQDSIPWSQIKNPKN